MTIFNVTTAAALTGGLVTVLVSGFWKGEDDDTLTQTQNTTFALSLGDQDQARGRVLDMLRQTQNNWADDWNSRLLSCMEGIRPLKMAPGWELQPYTQQGAKHQTIQNWKTLMDQVRMIFAGMVNNNVLFSSVTGAIKVEDLADVLPLIQSLAYGLTDMHYAGEDYCIVKYLDNSVTIVHGLDTTDPKEGKNPKVTTFSIGDIHLCGTDSVKAKISEYMNHRASTDCATPLDIAESMLIKQDPITHTILDPTPMVQYGFDTNTAFDISELPKHQEPTQFILGSQNPAILCSSYLAFSRQTYRVFIEEEGKSLMGVVPNTSADIRHFFSNIGTYLESRCPSEGYRLQDHAAIMENGAHCYLGKPTGWRTVGLGCPDQEQTGWTSLNDGTRLAVIVNCLHPTTSHDLDTWFKQSVRMDKGNKNGDPEERLDEPTTNGDPEERLDGATSKVEDVVGLRVNTINHTDLLALTGLKGDVGSDWKGVRDWITNVDHLPTTPLICFVLGDDGTADVIAKCSPHGGVVVWRRDSANIVISNWRLLTDSNWADIEKMEQTRGNTFYFSTEDGHYIQALYTAILTNDDNYIVPTTAIPWFPNQPPTNIPENSTYVIPPPKGPPPEVPGAEVPPKQRYVTVQTIYASDQTKYLAFLLHEHNTHYKSGLVDRPLLAISKADEATETWETIYKMMGELYEDFKISNLPLEGKGLKDHPTLMKDGILLKSPDDGTRLLKSYIRDNQMQIVDGQIKNDDQTFREYEEQLPSQGATPKTSAKSKNSTTMEPGHNPKKRGGWKKKGRKKGGKKW